MRRPATRSSCTPKVLKVMRQGLGDGTDRHHHGQHHRDLHGYLRTDLSSCAQPVTLEAKAPAGTAFVRWEGSCAGTTGTTCSFWLTSNRSVRAVFRLDPDVPPLPADLTPENIKQYLIDNPSVTTTAQFMRALPEEFRKGWILMTRSESLQTGTAQLPAHPAAQRQLAATSSRWALRSTRRIRARIPNAIEFMQWDGDAEELPLPRNRAGRTLVRWAAAGQFPARAARREHRRAALHALPFDPQHSIESGRRPGTTGIPAGIVKAKNKPNWDSYDSWGGMLPFNRDKIFPGSVEAAALRRLLNPWTWRNDEPSRRIMEQLELQSNAPGTLPVYPADDVFTRINGGFNDGHIRFAFDGGITVVYEPNPTGPTVGPVNYKFNGVVGAAPGSSVVRPADTPVILHAVGTPFSGEGRGVQLFDQLAGGDGGFNYNQIRIGDELANHRFATGSVRFDARPAGAGHQRRLHRHGLPPA